MAQQTRLLPQRALIAGPLDRIAAFSSVCNGDESKLQVGGTAVAPREAAHYLRDTHEAIQMACAVAAACD